MKCYWRDHTEKNQIGGACRAQERINTKYQARNLKGRLQPGRPGQIWKNIIKKTSKKQDTRMCTGITCLGVGLFFLTVEF